MDKIIVGLGNPGKKYKETRHNLGFKLLDRLAKKLDVEMSESQKFGAEIGDFNFGSSKIILVKPLTFMNESGRTVASIKNYYDTSCADIWVVYDDIDLPFGKIKTSWGGSSGGHRGVESLIGFLGTQEFPRIRIGVGRPQDADAKEWVLQKFTAQEQKEISQALHKAANAIKIGLEYGLEAAMNKFN